MTKERADYWEKVKALANTSPFYQLLGMELVELAEGYARFRMPVEDKLLQLYEAVHGGAIASLADSAAALALISLLTPAEKAVTVEMKINYLAPTLAGELIAEGRVVHKGGRLSVIDVEVRNNGERLVAKSLITYAVTR
ncbi:MAG: PaaI family thioesterase [Chloroflexi bacterium]|nr:PaaI family thioesterase [Chloroflexota bacterium]